MAKDDRQRDGPNHESNDKDDVDDVGVQIRVNFVLDPSVEDRSLEVPVEPIAVPADIRRKGLSAVVNHLLDRRVDNDKKDDESDSDDDDDDDDMSDKLPAIPFDFVVSKRLLRTGVESAARRYGLSLERSVTVTYFPAQVAPEEQGQSEPQPDWISSLSYMDGFVYATGYDGSLRVYSESKDGLSTMATATPHSSPIKCLAVSDYSDNSNSASGTQSLIATGSMDQTIALHVWERRSEKTQSGVLRKVAECTDGHTSSIGCLSIYSNNTDRQVMVSGDWDGRLCLWDLRAMTKNSSSSNDDDDDDDDATFAKSSRNKKQRSNKKGSSIPTAPTSVRPISSLTAHTSQISGAAWLNTNHVVTSSWDHSVKVWNMEREECGLTLNGSRVVSCMDLSRHSPVVATGHPDCTVRLWDVRTEGSEKRGNNNQNNSVSASSFDASLKPSHKAWVSGVQWSRTNPFLLASSSHDGTLKVWDIRSSLPLHTVRVVPKEEKALCLVFGGNSSNQGGDGEGNDNSMIYTGGTDCVVKRYGL